MGSSKKNSFIREKPFLTLFLRGMIGLFLLTSGCQKQHSNLVDSYKRVLPAPDNLVARINQNLIVLNWDYPDSLTIDFFQVFRQDSMRAPFVALRFSTTRQFIDSTVQNGQLYGYCVQAQCNDGRFSPRSEKIYATPARFGLMIENGKPYTNQLNVQVQLIAPPTTAAVCLSQIPHPQAENWQPFTATINWTLTAGDGIKKLYARFKDALGNFNKDLISDSIYLDTNANIYHLIENSGGRVLSAGDTLKIALNSGETHGLASASIGSYPPISLYDDGSHGDIIENDGIYENWWVISPGIEILNSSLIGHFTDQAGNAVQNHSPAKITIQNAPTPIMLLPPVILDSAVVKMNWSQNNDPDFYAYCLFKGNQPDIPYSEKPDTVILNREVTSCVVRHLKYEQSYYFKMVVVDSFGLSAASNEITVTLSSPPAPEPVFLYEPTDVTAHSITLQWTVATGNLFERYQIVILDSATATAPRQILKNIFNRGTTTWMNSQLQENSEYNYQVLVYNTVGRSTGSNIIKVKTRVDEPPQAVVLAQPTILHSDSIRLSWSRNWDDDFAGYYIYRTTQSPVEIKGTPITILNTANETHYIDVGLKMNRTYYYKVAVYDRMNKYSASNEVEVQLKP